MGKEEIVPAAYPLIVFGAHAPGNEPATVQDAEQLSAAVLAACDASPVGRAMVLVSVPKRDVERFPAPRSRPLRMQKARP